MILVPQVVFRQYEAEDDDDLLALRAGPDDQRAGKPAGSLTLI